jgi:hypothetical protein
MTRRLICQIPSTFEKLLVEAEANSKQSNIPLFLLFTGAKNPSTGVSWCPDCVKADPVIESELSLLDGGYTILVCEVDREEYRSKDYIFRKDSRINLKCVPTLIKWSNGKILASLNDSQSQIADLVKELLSA